jgi:hypothetical protein
VPSRIKGTLFFTLTFQNEVQRVFSSLGRLPPLWSQYFLDSLNQPPFPSLA